MAQVIKIILPGIGTHGPVYPTWSSPGQQQPWYSPRSLRMLRFQHYKGCHLQTLTRDVHSNWQHKQPIHSLLTHTVIITSLLRRNTDMIMVCMRRRSGIYSRFIKYLIELVTTLIQLGYFRYPLADISQCTHVYINQISYIYNFD